MFTEKLVSIRVALKVMLEVGQTVMRISAFLSSYVREAEALRRNVCDGLTRPSLQCDGKSSTTLGDCVLVLAVTIQSDKL